MSISHAIKKPADGTEVPTYDLNGKRVIDVAGQADTANEPIQHVYAKIFDTLGDVPSAAQGDTALQQKLQYFIDNGEATSGTPVPPPEGDPWSYRFNHASNGVPVAKLKIVNYLSVWVKFASEPNYFLAEKDVWPFTPKDT